MNIGLKKNVKDILSVFAIYMLGFLVIILALKYGHLPPQALVFFATFYLFFLAGQIIFKERQNAKTISIVPAFLLSSGWIVFPSLITKDITGIFVAFAALTLVWEMKLTFRQTLLIALGMTAFDVTNVYFTGLMMHLIEQLQIGTTPLTLSVTPEIGEHIKITMIGLGDIIFPGSLIIYAYRTAKQYAKNSLWICSLFGYFVGLLITIIMVNFFGSQPATLFLYPGVFLGFWLALVWNHIPLTLLFKNEV